MSKRFQISILPAGTSVQVARDITAQRRARELRITDLTVRSKANRSCRAALTTSPTRMYARLRCSPERIRCIISGPASLAKETSESRFLSVFLSFF